ncbi:MAG: alpha/beta hydrolase [Candidatus Tumulicola sp.]
MNAGEYVDVVSSDGVRLCVRSRGEREKPAIVFLHGFSQSHLSWAKQFEGELATQFHLIAFDLRGHGWSDKPGDVAAYREAQRWGDDVAAVLQTLGVTRAVLVGWSYGGRVILDYVKTHGTAAVAGIDFVAGVVGDEAAYYGSDIGTMRATLADDPVTNIDGTRRFLRACFAQQPDEASFERMLAYNAMVPPSIRAKLGGRKVDAHDLLAALNVPVLFTQGTADGIIAPAMSRYGAATVPHATLSLYDGIGHSPFFESSARFDRELAEFVRTCFA